MIGPELKQGFTFFFFCQLRCDVIGNKVRLVVAYLVASKPLNKRVVEGDLVTMNARKHIIKL